MASTLPQYYSILNVSRTATADEIRAAYKKESLRTHPDRLPGTATAAERRKATERFQIVADAYYVLSDPVRRAEYDSLFSNARSSRPSAGFGGGGSGFGSGTSTSSAGGAGAGGPPGGWTFTDDFASEHEQEQASSSFFENFAQFFPTAAGAAGTEPSEKAGGGGGFFGFGGGKKEKEEGRERPDAHGVFGDVFEEMLAPEVAHVRPFWSYAGGGAGATIGYIIANVPGAVAGGNRLGAIRDAKGKSVAQVFSGLGSAQKAEILRALAFKVLGSMAS